MITISVTTSISRAAGGLQQSVRRLHQTLNELPGMKVFIATMLDEYSEQDVHEWLPLTVITAPVIGLRAFGFAPELVPKLLEVEAEICHTHGLWKYTSIAVSRWHEKTRRPYLISPHGMLDPWAVRNSAWKKRIALTFYERKHLEKSACIRALCDAEAQAIRQFGLRNPICVIPNGIDIPNARIANLNGQRAPWNDGLTNGKKVLLYLGRLHPKKGLFNLIRAWAEVRKEEGRMQKAEEWILAIAGWDQGGHEDDLKRLATESGMAWADIRDQKSGGSRLVSAFSSKNASLLFLGPQFGDDKASCYAHCDAFILPSFSEGLPMVILEAWAYGKPVLMTAECNLPEGFAANAAIQIKPNVESITNGLKSLFKSSDDSVLALGTNGRTLVASRFNWPKAARDMLKVYNWLRGSGAKPSVVI